MLINLRNALRHLWKNKLFSIINILGLSLGLACCFVILLHIKFELSYDRFHDKKDRIVRVLYNNFAFTPMVMATVLPEYFPEIEKVVRIRKFDWVKAYVIQNHAFIEENDFVCADSTFFDIFSFPIIGNKGKLLRSPDKIMLSEKIAKKYFGNEDPVGKVISLRLVNSTINLTIEGVYKDFPEQSHFHANFLLPIEFFARQVGMRGLTNWGTNSIVTYILLKDPGMKESVSKRIPGFIDKYVPKDVSKDMHYRLQSLTRIHLYANEAIIDIEPQGSITQVLIFGSIAVLVLIIAVVNFILLSLALSYQRTREFGIRKVVGARTRELVALVSAEFLIVFVLAMQIALMLVEISIPLFKNKMNLGINHGIFSNTGLLILFIGIVVLLGYAACIYITGYFSRFRPIDVLRSTMPIKSRRLQSRGVLVIFQFIIMIGLLSCLIVMQKQLLLLRNKDLGFRKEQLLNINIPAQSANESKDNKYSRLKSELKSIPEVLNVSGAAYIPPNREYWTIPLKNPLTSEEFELEEINGDYDLIETMGIEITKGRSFSRSFGMDSSAILINETAVKTTGLKEPLESYLTGPEYYPGRSRMKIIGVFKDFHVRSLYENVKPMAIFLSPGMVYHMIVRLSNNASKPTIHRIENTWKSIFPDDPIQYEFVDEGLHEQYTGEDQTYALISLFSYLSLVIALMGLFGLSAFSIERRTKETGIRKVNGARDIDIFYVLSRQFGIWIVIAFLIATPVAWYAMHNWLQHFAYKTELSWWVFALSGIISICVALITIFWQSYKAATRNPVDALRYE
jgi:putative ABC transport system permease protein